MHITPSPIRSQEKKNTKKEKTKTFAYLISKELHGARKPNTNLIPHPVSTSSCTVKAIECLEREVR